MRTAGTGTYRLAIEHGAATEVQPGSYVVMDGTYAPVQPRFENALFASPFDDQHQLLCADLGLGPNLGAEQACYLPGDCRQQRDDRTQDARQEIHRP